MSRRPFKVRMRVPLRIELRIRPTNPLAQGVVWPDHADPVIIEAIPMVLPLLVRGAWLDVRVVMAWVESSLVYQDRVEVIPIDDSLNGEFACIALWSLSTLTHFLTLAAEVLVFGQQDLEIENFVKFECLVWLDQLATCRVIVKSIQWYLENWW